MDNAIPIRSRDRGSAANRQPLANAHAVKTATTDTAVPVEDNFEPDCYNNYTFSQGGAVQDVTDTSMPFTDGVEELPSSTPSQLVPYQSANPITISPFFELNLPAFSEFSQSTNRRSLLNHFCNVMSHLIVLREDHGNPFQQLVVPLSQQSSAVKSAIYALSSAHLEVRGVANTESSIMLHNDAIRSLSKLIEQGSNANKNELLAAIILLVYYEVVRVATKLTKQINANSFSWFNESGPTLSMVI